MSRTPVGDKCSYRCAPIFPSPLASVSISITGWPCACRSVASAFSSAPTRSEEHTSELQSRLHLVCRLLLEKKKKTIARIALKQYLLMYLIRHVENTNI